MYIQQAYEHVSIPDFDSNNAYIKKYNNEIQKAVILLNKLSKMLYEEKISSEAYTSIADRYSGKLESVFTIRDIYQKIVLDESLKVDVKLDSIVEKNNILLTKRKIKDIGEEEFDIKIRPVQWELDLLNNKKLHLDETLVLFYGLDEMINMDIVSDIAVVMEDGFKLYETMGVEEEIISKIVSTFKRILEISNST